MVRLAIVMLLVTVGMAVLFMPVCACSTKEMAYRATLKSDLRSLSMAESLYAESTGHFSDDHEALNYTPSTGVTIDIALAESSWSAGAVTRAFPDGRCTMSGADSAPVCEGFYYPQYSLFSKLTRARRPAR